MEVPRGQSGGSAVEQAAFGELGEAPGEFGAHAQWPGRLAGVDGGLLVAGFGTTWRIGAACSA
ncbi:hypothetical protein [Actinokineospora iranica]|uniref:Uncharacterized protein n=1 Tax=Actinokineospora iranica TaxID=1271860 RepID=A0A1G6ZIF8_9PSEU|nr:hypothetical protein [Actinokineospora iranica]SDE02449.1 hypothetical protein SAMN05216174_1351 [Actinokineospora iranica]